MKVQTFMGKLGIEPLHQMDEHINHWLEENHVEPKRVTQCFGYERGREGHADDPIVVTSVWY